jgi:hypothetical protein
MLRRFQAARRQVAMNKANRDLLGRIGTALIAQRRSTEVKNDSSFVKDEIHNPVTVGYYPAANEVQIYGPTESVMKELREFLIGAGFEVGEVGFHEESTSWVLPGIGLK